MAESPAPAPDFVPEDQFYRCTTCCDYFEKAKTCIRMKANEKAGEAYEVVHARITVGEIHQAVFCGPCVPVAADKVPTVTVRLTDSLQGYLKGVAEGLGGVTTAVAAGYLLRRMAGRMAYGVSEREAYRAMAGKAEEEAGGKPAVH